MYVVQVFLFTCLMGLFLVISLENQESKGARVHGMDQVFINSGYVWNGYVYNYANPCDPESKLASEVTEEVAQVFTKLLKSQPSFEEVPVVDREAHIKHGKCEGSLKEWTEEKLKDIK